MSVVLHRSEFHTSAGLINAVETRKKRNFPSSSSHSYNSSTQVEFPVNLEYCGRIWKDDFKLWVFNVTCRDFKQTVLKDQELFFLLF